MTRNVYHVTTTLYNKFILYVIKIKASFNILKCVWIYYRNINATKAGMDGLDKDAINAIIEQASRGSKFFDAKAKAQKRIDAKIESMKSKMNSLSEEAIEVARIKADKLILEIKSSAEINDNSKVIVHVDMVLMHF